MLAYVRRTVLLAVLTYRARRIDPFIAILTVKGRPLLGEGAWA